MPIQAANRVTDRLLGPSIDAAAIDGRKTRWLRLLFGAVTAIVINANLGSEVAFAWWSVSFGAEAFAWLSSHMQVDGRAGARAARLSYLFAIMLATINWSLVAVLYWLSYRPGLQAVAIVVASSLLIHAQAFAFRSRAVFIINAGIPALLLILLVLVFSPLSGAEWITAAFGVGTAITYVITSAHANRTAARRIQQAQDELERVAYSDALTSLANRRRFGEDIERLLTYSRRHNTRFALMLIDLDCFKAINDEMGHDVGDALLVTVARRLRALTAGDDHVARLGGDEFALLIANAVDSDRIGALCQEILAGVATTLDFKGQAVNSTLSIGVAVYPQDGDEQETLFKSADLALYAAKNSGRNTWRAYEADLAA